MLVRSALFRVVSTLAAKLFAGKIDLRRDHLRRWTK